MKIKIIGVLVATAMGSLALTSCGGDADSHTVSRAAYTLKGRLANTHINSLRREGLVALAAKTVSHVMAVNPESSNVTRYVSKVSANGSFTLNVVPNRPYVLVFVDSSKVGENMIAGIFKAETLDSVAPIGTDGTTDLGELSVDPATGEATSDVDYSTLISRLGLSAGDALTLGEVDDLSLRYVNPDIDGNGTIDELENKKFALDFHVRADTKKGNGTDLTVNDVVDRYADSSGAAVALANFTLSSVYALYPSSFDGTVCVAGSALKVGCSFTSSVPNPPSSYSNLAYGNMNGFGADYAHPAKEMPGSAGAPVKLNFEFNGHTLTFPNVVTRNSNELESSGTIIPFVQFVTASGKILQIKYKWMKKIGALEWTDASDDEVKLIVNDDGGYYAVYINTDHASDQRAKNIGFRIKRTATGTIPFNLADSSGDSNMTAAEVAAVTPEDICNSAFSYDDKLGLRIFAGAPTANVSRTVCP